MERSLTKGHFMIRILLALTALLLSTSAWANVPNATPLFNQYNCNSSTTQFPYAFPITATSDMTVYITDSNGNISAQTGTFSVDQSNVWVNYPLVGSPCATGSTITLIPSTPQTQITAYGARTPFTATAVGSSFDKLTLISQQLQGQINRALLLPVNSGNTSPQTFPTASPGSLIGWNVSSQLANINNPAAVAQWSLSGANISYNTGNVSTTHTLTGATLTDGTATLTGGTLTGNVVGNLTGTINTASQPNITSLGTLSSLATTGNVGVGTPIPTTGRLIVSGGNVGIGTGIPGMLLNVQGGNVGIGTVVAGQALVVNGTVQATSYTGAAGAGLLGAWTSKSLTSVIQATTDGFAVCYVNAASGTSIMSLTTDSSNPPTTVRCAEQQAATTAIGCMSPVRKNDYYECNTTGSTGGSQALYFIPIGS